MGLLLPQRTIGMCSLDGRSKAQSIPCLEGESDAEVPGGLAQLGTSRPPPWGEERLMVK